MSKEEPIVRAIFMGSNLDFPNPTPDGDSIMKGDFVRVTRNGKVIIERDQIRVLKANNIYESTINHFSIFPLGISIILVNFDDFQKGDIIDVIERTVKS